MGENGEDWVKKCIDIIGEVRRHIGIPRESRVENVELKIHSENVNAREKWRKNDMKR